MPRDNPDPEGGPRQMDAAWRSNAAWNETIAANEQAHFAERKAAFDKAESAWRSEAPRNASQPKRDAARPAKTRTG